jgi:glycosyltransferase involved in cell wall biosynthesis
MPNRPLVGLDTTPLASGHANRGIGRYVHGVMAALVSEESAWCREHLGLLISRGQATPSGVGRWWRTIRSAVRPQDVDWIVAAIADRIVTASAPADLWHETDPGAPFGIGDPARAIVTAYDLIPLLDESVRTRVRPHRWAVYRLYLRRLKQARMIIAISEATAEDLVRVIGIDPRRIQIVPPAVLPLRSTVTPDRSPDPSDAGALLFVGVPDPHKRAELAILALEALHRRGGEMRLLFLGHHPDRARRSLRELVSQHRLDLAVEFRDHVTDDDLARLYASGILLALSTREGFGLPAVESLISGGRVVATPTPVYREVLGQAATFADDDSPEAIAAAIAFAATRPADPELAARLATRYSGASVAASLVAAYQRAHDVR